MSTEPKYQAEAEQYRIYKNAQHDLLRGNIPKKLQSFITLMEYDTAGAIQWIKKKQYTARLNLAPTHDHLSKRASPFSNSPLGPQEQYILGCMSYHGLGTWPDPFEAADWFKASAEQGYALAQYSLALCYKRGYGIPLDAGKAVTWFTKAAAQGHPPALYELAKHHHDGDGTDKNLPMAIALYQEAIRGGEYHAKRDLWLAQRALSTLQQSVKKELLEKAKLRCYKGHKTLKEAIKIFNDAPDNQAQYHRLDHYGLPRLAETFDKAITTYAKELADPEKSPEIAREIALRLRPCELF